MLTDDAPREEVIATACVHDMARVRVLHDIRLEYIMSELPWACPARYRGQYLGAVEAKRVSRPRVVPFLHARECGSQKNLVQK